VLIGPWPLAGGGARLLSGLLGLLHLAAGAGLAWRRPWGLRLCWWLTALLTGLAAVSVLTANSPALASAGGGIVPAGLVRWLLGVVVALGAALLWSLGRLTPSPGRPG
jgi:hypothetical protein